MSEEELKRIIFQAHGQDAKALEFMQTQIAALTAKLETVKNLLNGLGRAGYCTAEIATHAPNWQGKLPACDCGLDEILREVGP